MTQKTPSRPINILFIGNSFTQRNNLPTLLARMAAVQNVALNHELISAGGASLRTHWNAGQAARKLAAGVFDYVVLQEQSTLPIKNVKRMAENVRLFDEAIQMAGSKTVLYMTWARSNAPESQKAITDAYTGIAEELGAILIPIGLAWQQFLSEFDTPVLHDRDGSHPTLAGSYLAACVFMVELLKLNPVGIETDLAGLTQHEMRAMQSFVWKLFGNSR